ncbi:rRNA pseudouridine synthase [Candidatus Saccharibacteria bacterium]|nr:rRNA pseudouridine synthase [Candidatus Saccharibacteria bacterium]
MTEGSATIRLNKYLALQLGISRREADDYISRGEVTINNTVAELGARFLESDAIKVRGELVKGTTEFEYIAFNKPVNYVCSRRQQGDSPTIYDRIPEQYHALKPVGRLDRDSSGLILLTNDGDFAFEMTHPKFTKVKIYQIVLDRDLAPLHQQMISDRGISLEDGVSKLQLERRSEEERTSWTVTMHEGRNRQIRRTFNSLGYEVASLHRTNFGPYQLGDLETGAIEIVTKK